MRRYFFPINGIQWMTLVLALAIAVCVPVLFFRIQDVQQHQNDALRSIICFVEHREKLTLPAKQKAQAVAFWSKALSDARLKPCD